MRDMVQKGRSPNNQGEAHPRAKLNEASVVEIRRVFDDGELLEDIARKFGITCSYVSEVVSGKRWKHVAYKSTRKWKSRRVVAPRGLDGL
jgi:hypothetical protein